MARRNDYDLELLLHLIREGKVHEVFDIVYDDVVRLCRAACARAGIYDPQDQADILQDVLIDLLKALPTYSGRAFGIESFMAFVRTIANRRCIDWIRGKARSRSEPLYDEQGEVGQAVQDAIGLAPSAAAGLCARRALEELQQTRPQWCDRLAMLLCEGESLEELAKHLEIAYGSVRSLLSEIRKEMKRLCVKHCGTADCSPAI